MDPKTFQYWLDRVTEECDQLAQDKNHDYGAAWTDMRPSSITDQILVKVKRIKRLEDMATRGENPRVAEGIKSEYRDICNYARFFMIQLLWSELSQSPPESSPPSRP